MKGTLSDKRRRTRFAHEPAAKARKTVPASLLAATLAALCIAVLLWAAPARAAGYTVAVDPATTWGTWQGWGTSLCWEGNVAGNQADQTQLLYSTSATTINANGQNVTLPGLGMNIVRYNLGGCSSGTLANGQTMVTSNVSPTSAQYIQGFEITPNTWNWNVDANQRQMLQNAKADGANYFEMFSNSPMWWMCNNYNPAGAAGGGDNLNMSYANSFANYIATAAQYFSQNYGITFNAVEPFNEPMGGWWTSTKTSQYNADSQEGCHVDPSEQATVIGLLRTQLNNVGLTGTAIAASDENSTGQAISTWNSFSSTTQSQVGWVQTHGYGFNNTAASQLYNAAQGKQIWDSEYGENDTSGLRMAENINQNFTYLHSTAWCYWLPIEGANWGLINGDVSTGTMGTVNPKYYVMAQYSRSIRQGMTILTSGDPNTVTAYDPVNHDLWLVTTNTGSAAETVTYNLGNFNYSQAGQVTGWCTLCNGGSNYQQFSGPAITGGNLSLSFAASSVQTLEIPNVFLGAGLTGGTWAVSGGSGAWSSATNWSPSTVPGVYTAAAFAGGGGTCVVNAAGCTANTLSFSNSAPFALANSGGNGVAVQSNITVSNSSNVTISAPLTLVAASTWSITPRSTMYVSSAVNEGSSLTETGGGMLVLEAVNSALTGPVTVSGGTLYAANTQNSGNEVLGNASWITINSGGVIQVDGPLGAGYNSLVGGGHTHPNIYINRGGLLAQTTAAAISNHLGQLVLDGGTVSAMTPNPVYGTWNLDGGVTTPGDIGTTSYIVGGDIELTQHTIVSGGSATVFNIAPGDTLVMAAVISSTFSSTSSRDNLVFQGGGTLILAASNGSGNGNLFNRSTYVNAGRLLLGKASALSSSLLNISAGTVGFVGINGGLEKQALLWRVEEAQIGGLAGNGGTLLLTGTNGSPVALTVAQNGSSTTYSGSITGSGGSLVLASGTLTLSGSDNYSGGTYVDGGELIVASAAVLPAGSSLMVGAEAASIFAPFQAADSPVNAVPEPPTLALLVAAAIVVAVGRKRSRIERIRIPMRMTER